MLTYFYTRRPFCQGQTARLAASPGPGEQVRACLGRTGPGWRLAYPEIDDANFKNAL